MPTPRFLLLSDLHANASAARQLVERSAQVDVVIGAGDFGNVRRQLSVCLDILRAIQIPTLLVAGNNESTEELRAACQGWPAAYILHGTAVTIKDVVFYGIGGGIPVTPFGAWSYDFSEEEAAQLLAACPPESVLITHSPPYGAVDVDGAGRHLGSRAIHDAILRVRPRLVVCGHIHGSAGQQAWLGSTPVVNAGPDGVEWRLSK
jgi:Icc-related predicted phosphoesterase